MSTPRVEISPEIVADWISGLNSIMWTRWCGMKLTDSGVKLVQFENANERSDQGVSAGARTPERARERERRESKRGETGGETLAHRALNSAEFNGWTTFIAASFYHFSLLSFQTFRTEPLLPPCLTATPASLRIKRVGTANYVSNLAIIKMRTSPLLGASSGGPVY